jgi:hypothetical protein
MSAGSKNVIRAGVVVCFVALGIPATALAGGGGKCNASACKVYVEPNGPSAGKQQQQPQQQQPTSGSTKGKGKTHVPKNLARALSQAGKDRRPLQNLLTGGDLGSMKGGANAGSPTMLGAAFDLGAGPLVLLAILLATACGLAARGSVRSWLHRRSGS